MRVWEVAEILPNASKYRPIFKLITKTQKKITNPAISYTRCYMMALYLEIMRKTAMQDLKEDLQETINTAKDALLEIENEGIRAACQEVVRLTLKNIIKRIDEELLEAEKKQLIGFGYSQIQYIDAEIGDLIYNKVPEEIYRENFGDKVE